MLPQGLAGINLTLIARTPYGHSETKAGYTMRLFIADADQELRVSLQLLLHQEPGMLVVGIAVHAKGLLAQLAPSKPDVLLLDWLLPGRPAEDLLADLHALERRPQIIVLSVRPEVESAAMAAGADAFVTKAGPSDRLIAILRDMRSKLADGAPPTGGVPPVGGVPPRIGVPSNDD